MQRIVNVLAITSFAVSTAVIGTAGYVFLNKEALIEQIKDAALGQVGAIAGNAVKDLMPDIPNIPTSTGPVISRPSAGLGVPKL